MAWALGPVHVQAVPPCTSGHLVPTSKLAFGFPVNAVIQPTEGEKAMPSCASPVLQPQHQA